MGADSELPGQLQHLAATKRMVFVAGLPGTGKSFFVHQLAHLAHAAGRTAHLLQWDVVRPVFETSAGGRRYPTRRGVTHPVIRKAAGIWVRDGLARWQQRYIESTHLLIGEVPLVGHRFIELARRADDVAEPLLTAASCLFMVPVPSVEVRRILEAERDRRMRRHLHDREREDAPPNVLRELWEELVGVARLLGIDATKGQAAAVPYDPALYEGVYRRVLAHRRVETVAVKELLPGVPVSVYAFAFPTHDVVPTGEETAGFIQMVEEQYRDLGRLQHEMDRWYVV